MAVGHAEVTRLRQECAPQEAPKAERQNPKEGQKPNTGSTAPVRIVSCSALSLRERSGGEGRWRMAADNRSIAGILGALGVDPHAPSCGGTKGSAYAFVGSVVAAAGSLPNAMNTKTQKAIKMAGGMKNPFQLCRWAFR